MTDHAGVPKVLQRTDLVGEWNVGRWPVQVVQIEVAQPGSPATILGRLLEMGGPAIQSAVGQLGAGEDDTPLVDHQFARVRPQRILDQRLVRVRSI